MLYYTDNIPIALPADIVAVLPQERLRKAECYHRSSDRVLCGLAYYLFAYGIEKEYGIPLEARQDWEYNGYGKPFLSGYPHINFNVSHCSEAVFCGFSSYPIGVDVQGMISDIASISPMVCTAAELERLEASDEPERLFTRFWCLKEAYFKQQGTGITDALNRIDFSDIEGSGMEKYGLCFSAFEISDRCFAVCGKEAFTRKDLILIP